MELLILVRERVLWAKVDMLQNNDFIREIERADLAAEHVKARMRLITEQTIT